ncbi:MAG: FISUMP domain-containing protein, partial [Bacteroidota bacterium]
MKKQLLCCLFLALLILTSIQIFAQVGINTDGSDPDSSAMLDVKSTTHGILIPRVSVTQRDLIPSPATGLLIYNTSTNLFNYFNGNYWLQVETAFISSTIGTISEGRGVSINASPDVSPDNSAMLDVNNPSRGILIPRTTPDQINSPAIGLIIYNITTNLLNYYNGDNWITLCALTTGVAGAGGSQSSIGLAIKTDNSDPDQSALLDVSAADKGVLIPRLSNEQRDDILPATGLVIYNSSSNNIEFYNGSGWYHLVTNLVLTPAAWIHVPAANQIIWNWTPVSEVTGYKWNTVNDYASATDLGTSTTFTETGLTCNTNYTRFIWAYNDCGYSVPLTLTQATWNCETCGTIIVNHIAGTVSPVNKNVTYGTVLNLPGEPMKCWITSNLGSDNQATSVADTTEPSAGWYWQFNRKQGYKHDGTTRTPNTTWITSIIENLEWQPANDPCTIELGNNWRIPTYAEWLNVYNSCGWTNRNGPWNSGLKLHAAGYLWISDGTLTYRGSDGYYWSTAQFNVAAGWGLFFNNEASYLYNQFGKGLGFTQRCIKYYCIPPDILTPSTNVPSSIMIIWKWNTHKGATGYKWNTVNDFNTAIDLGTANTKTEVSLTCNTAYTRYVWAYNDCGHSTVLILNQSTLACLPCESTITDGRDGKTYNTVLIGDQCWMKENLNIGTRINSTQDQSNNGIIEKYCYGNVESNCDVYGGMYMWNELMDYTASSNSNPSERKGICPTGWHLPSDAEWCQIETYLDPAVDCNSTGWQNTDAGGKMKEAGTLHWAPPNTGATNSSGFTALPGGIVVNNGGIFHYLTAIVDFWSTTESSSDAWTRGMHNELSTLNRNLDPKTMGLGARCLRDTCTVVPGRPTSGTHSSTYTQIIWNWNTVPGAIGYKWNTVDDYNTATDMGTSTTKTETGLTCSNYYYRYVWSYNTCGYSTFRILVMSTITCWTCGNPLYIDHVEGTVAPVTKTVAYGTAYGIPGEPSKCWITRNLGATQQAGNVGDPAEASAGWYWQFNRMQGYKHDGTTRTPNTTWITFIDENAEWQATNDPCATELGNGWHVPTALEWYNADLNGGWINLWSVYYSSLKLHLAGGISFVSGALLNRGYTGYYWSNNQYNTNTGYILNFSSDCDLKSGYNKANAFPIRCLKDPQTQNPPTVSTNVFTNKTSSSVTTGGSVSSDGGASVTARGVCWGTSSVPAIADSHTSDGSGAGTFSSNISDLEPNTLYYFRAYATNSIGTSYGNELTFTTLGPTSNCGSFTINHVAGSVAPVSKTVTYYTVTNIPGEISKCWITSNLGADHEAATVDDGTEASAGWYWQFNRRQGYKNDGTTPTPAWTITSIDENSDWESVNDPCNIELGDTWRVPTYTEWLNVDATGDWSNWNGPWNSGLKLHAAGYLSSYDGSLWARDDNKNGYYWSSVSGGNTNGYHLAFSKSGSYMNYNSKAFGFSLRCLKYFNQSPYQPSNPGPGTGAFNQSINTTLSWSCSDPENNPLTFDVFLGTTNPPSQVSTGQSGYTYNPGTLQINTIYFWKIVAHDDHGNMTEGPVWMFSTYPQFTCGIPVPVTHVAGDIAPVNKSINYNTVLSDLTGYNKCWITQNLGAGQQATAVDDNTEASAGWYWQFNRKQGYKHNGTKRTPNSTWITTINEDSDWLPENDPCRAELGIAWRIPTLGEWYNTNLNGGWNNWFGPWNSDLKIHASGFLYGNDGSLGGRGSNGNFWGSMQFHNNENAVLLNFSIDYSGTFYNIKSCGFSLRCLRFPCSVSPDAPASGSHIPGKTQIIWRWNDVNGSTGYKWNTTNDYETATDLGTDTSKVETGLTCNTAYSRFVWAYNECGHSFVLQMNQTTAACNSCGSPITDSRDGKTYNTVFIGDQCWMKENLNIGTRINSTQDQTNNGIIEKYCYGNIESNCDVYGGMYMWNELMNYTTSSNDNPSGRTGICPAGWHLPSDAEWCQLETYLDPAVDCNSTGWQNTDAGGKMKEAGTVHWAPPNTGATNSSGFTSLPGGIVINNGGIFQYLTTLVDFWSSTEYGSDAWTRGMHNELPTLNRNHGVKTGGLGARCLRDTCSFIPNTPSSAGNTSDYTQITWRWNAVNGAKGYKWNNVNIYETATDLGTTTTKTEYGLTCNTSYIRYVWAYTDCENSPSLVMNKSTLVCPCGPSFTINHFASGNFAPVNKMVTYGTVTNIPGEPTKCWITSNLGADHQASAVDDGTEASAGWYWQFNRKQGYKHDGTTRTPNTIWISSIDVNTDWQNENDPCTHEV